MTRNTAMADLPIDDYIAALEKMKKSRRDRIGILGELGVTGLGVAGGIAASGAAAAAAGAATIFGSTTLASIFGGVLVTTTPVGWVIGSAMAGGALAYAVAKLVRGGGKYDALKQVSIRELEERIQLLRKKARWSLRREPKVRKIIDGLELLVANAHISQDKATALLEAIEKKHLRPAEAFNWIQALIEEKASLQKASG